MEKLDEEISLELAALTFGIKTINFINRNSGITKVQWRTENQQENGSYFESYEISDNDMAEKLKRVCGVYGVSIYSGLNSLGWFAVVGVDNDFKWSAKSEYIAILHAVEFLLEENYLTKGQVGRVKVHTQARDIISKMCKNLGIDIEDKLLKRISKIEELAGLAGGSVVSRQVIAVELQSILDKEE